MAIGYYSDRPSNGDDSIDVGGGFAGGAEFGEDTIPANVETDIVTFTIPAGRYLILKGGSASGGTDTIFKFYVDGNVKEIKRNAWTDRNVVFGASTTLVEGSVVTITAEHHSVIAHLTNATLFGTLYVSG